MGALPALAIRPHDPTVVEPTVISRVVANKAAVLLPARVASLLLLPLVMRSIARALRIPKPNAAARQVRCSALLSLARALKETATFQARQLRPMCRLPFAILRSRATVLEVDPGAAELSGSPEHRSDSNTGRNGLQTPVWSDLGAALLDTISPIAGWGYWELLPAVLAHVRGLCCKSFSFPSAPGIGPPERGSGKGICPKFSRFWLCPVRWDFSSSMTSECS